jgi:hypothetical protein
MGTLIYGDSELELKFDDRVLAHLQLIIGSKLRRGESFFMSWQDSFDSGSGRSAVWLDRAIPLLFKFKSAAVQPINPQWLELLNRTASSASGLQLVSEPERAVPPGK